MASIATTFSFLFHFLVLMLSQLSNLSNGNESLKDGFILELIHRDSPKSPFYNPLETDSDRLRNAVQRSMSRINHFHRSSSKSRSFQSKFVPSEGEYVTKISVGSPPFEVMVLIDTGSDITWIQCKPCISCFKQTSPIFDFKKSSTFKTLPCKSNFCQKNTIYRQVECENTDPTCPYQAVYADNSYTIGVVATDTFTFSSPKGRPVAIPKLVLGCGLNNSAIFSGSAATGILGLDYSSLSLITQLNLKKFSYCLAPFKNFTGTLKFGNLATISGKNNIVSTPFISNDIDTKYFMSLEGISVGNKRFSVTPNVTHGNMYIDSGATLSYLPNKLYSMIISELKRTIEFKPIKAPTESLDLCYKSNLNIKVPSMTYHFTGGADIKLTKSNTFIQMDDQGIECFAAASDDSVFGNLFQRNFQVEYDLSRKMISFAQADCTKF